MRFQNLGKPVLGGRDQAIVATAFAENAAFLVDQPEPEAGRAPIDRD